MALGVIAGPGARLRYLAARALLPSADDHEFLRLPLALYPLYYLLRPVRVLVPPLPLPAAQAEAELRVWAQQPNPHN